MSGPGMPGNRATVRSARLRGKSASRCRGDGGQISLLIVFFGLVILGFTTVIVDLSTVFLAQRALQATADGAALTAAQHVSLAGAYTTEPAEWLPLSDAEVYAAVADYVGEPGRAPQSCRSGTLSITAATLDATDRTVSVSLGCTVSLPIVNVITGSWWRGVPIARHADARLLVLPSG